MTIGRKCDLRWLALFNMISQLFILKRVLALVTLIICAPSQASIEQPPFSWATMDSAIVEILKQNKVPGAVVGFIKQNTIQELRAYGRISAVDPRPVDQDTLFRMGSISKSFTGLAAALLAVQGKLSLDDPITKYLPELKFPGESPFSGLTLRDFLTHRTGLDLQALDLLLWPAPNLFTSLDLLAAARSIRRVAPIRAQFSYSNAAYAVAGIVIARVSKQSYDQFVLENIFKPLNMSGCQFGRYDSSTANVAIPHMEVQGTVIAIRPDVGIVPIGNDAAAGGVRCTAHAMLQWLRFVSNPKSLSDTQLVNALALAASYQIINTDGNMYSNQDGSMQSYGLGLELLVGQGQSLVSHSGGVSGMYSYFGVWPYSGDGIFVMINKSSGTARTELIKVLRSLLGHADVVKVAPLLPVSALASKDKQPTNKLHSHGANLEGKFQSNWIGPVSICREAGRMTVRVTNSPRLVGELRKQSQSTTDAIYWDDPAVDSDSIVETIFTKGRNVLMFKLKPLTISDFDFSYITFRRTGAC